MHVEWTIDGKAAPLLWDSAQLDAPGGYGNLSGVSVRAEDMPSGAGSFSVVVGTRSDGVGFYRGEIAGVPQIVDGQAVFAVQGLRERLRRRRARRLYQSQALDEWSLSDADPFSAGGYPMADQYDVTVKDGAILFVIHAETYVLADRLSVSFWARGDTIRRVAFDIDRTLSSANHEIRLMTAAGPDGGASAEAPTYSLTGTATINVDKTLDVPDDMLQIQVRANGASAPGAKRRAIIRNLRVNGRTLGDTFSLSDLSADIAAEMEFSDLSPGTVENILPQDWTDDWYTAMSDAVDTQDAIWLVMEPRPFVADVAGLYVGDWGRQTFYVVDLDYSEVENLPPYNTAYVSYETPSGIEQVVSATADPDPYEGTGQIVAWPEDEPFHLSGPRYSDGLAGSLAQKYADHYSLPQVAGRVHVTRLFTEAGEHHPWDINAGDMLELRGYETAPGAGALSAQRVVTVSRRPDGTADVSVGEDETFTAKLSRAQARRLRRRRRRHR
jgi:hypothetical protein